MNMFFFLFAHTLVAGALGFAARLYIAGFLLSTESIKSPRIRVRYFYRYVIFNSHYIASLMLTPALLNPFLEQIRKIPNQGDFEGILYLLICLPLASLFYYADYKFIVYADAKKIRGRDKFKKKFG